MQETASKPTHKKTAEVPNLERDRQTLCKSEKKFNFAKFVEQHSRKQSESFIYFAPNFKDWIVSSLEDKNMNLPETLVDKYELNYGLFPDQLKGEPLPKTVFSLPEFASAMKHLVEGQITCNSKYGGLETKQTVSNVFLVDISEIRPDVGGVVVQVKRRNPGWQVIALRFPNHRIIESGSAFFVPAVSSL